MFKKLKKKISASQLRQEAWARRLKPHDGDIEAPLQPPPPPSWNEKG